MRNVFIFAGPLAIAISVASPAPSISRDLTGRLNEIAQQCRQNDSGLSVGQCLSLEVEQSTNELAAACTYLRELGYIGGPEGVFDTVGECIDYLKTAED